MIEAHRVDAVEARQIVLVRRVVAVPRHHVERRVIDLGDPQLAEEFGDDAAIGIEIFERRDGRQKIARVGEAVGADRAEFGQAERRAVVFADVAARRAVGQIDAELDAARDDADFPGRDLEHAEFGGDARAPLLRDEQQFAIGVVEVARLHGGVGGVDVDRDAGLRGRVAAAGDGHQAIDEIGGRLGDGKGIPAKLVGRRGHLVERAAAQQAGRIFGERLVRDGRANSIGPGAPVGGARRGERAAAELLGVESERRLLRRVLANRERAGYGLRGEFIPEAGLVTQFGGRHTQLALGLRD